MQWASSGDLLGWNTASVLLRVSIGFRRVGLLNP